MTLASKLVQSVMLKNPEAVSSDQLRMIADAFPDLLSTHGLQSEYERWWVKWHEDKDVGGTISNFVDSLHWADNDLYPNVKIILFISAFRPSTTASNERSFSTLKRLKTYLRSTMTAVTPVAYELTVATCASDTLLAWNFIFNFSLFEPHAWRIIIIVGRTYIGQHRVRVRCFRMV